MVPEDKDTQTNHCKFYQVVKTPSGFEDLEGSLLSCVLHLDKDGIYIGQEQLNCLDNHPDALPTLFLKPQGDESEWMSLTKEEMDRTF